MARDARLLMFLSLAAVLSMVFTHTAGEESNPEKPARAHLERVDVDLILIDVEARDDSGRPMRGLTADDFEIRVNGVPRPVYSADDRCGCIEAPPSSGESAGSETPGVTGVSPASSSVPDTTGGDATSDPARFILYFDFALMDLDGRRTAIEAARRWITETMRDTDEVTIIGSTFAIGAVTLAETTSDRSMLLSALRTMEESRDFVDPHFPFLHSRRRECSRDWVERPISLPFCNANAHDEYIHTRGTLKTLAYYLESLDPVERKHLILFHEIVPFRPADLFPGARLRETQEPAAELVGATAVASRVTVHAAGTHGARPVGQLIAEYTGGTWNSGPADFQAMLEEARNRCECLYRLGIEPRDRERGDILTITVAVRNRSVANLRMKVRTETDRWVQKARSVLSNPAAARDLPVHAALVPVEATARGWTVKVQVALNASALARLPTSRGIQAEWEVGARLVREGSQDAWDMLATSTMNAASGATGPDWLVHERAFVDLPAGTYRLGSFVRDRSVDLFGGASSMLELPDPGVQSVAGPVPLLAGRRILTAALPLTTPATSASTRGVPRSSGLVPPGEAVTGEEGGPPLEIMTWLCGAGIPPSPAAPVERSLRFENDVVMTFPAEAEWEDAGVCVRLMDPVETGLLDDASYRYHLRWNRPGNEDPIEVEADLP